MRAYDLRRLTAPEHICTLIVKCYQWLGEYIGKSNDEAFRMTPGPGKPLYAADRWAEKFFYSQVTWRFPDVRVIRTEEAIPTFDISEGPDTCVLIDILDGAHLYQRGLSNWCSAITIFDRHNGKIHGAYIALPATETLYFATETDNRAFTMRIPDLNRMDRRPEVEDGNSPFRPDSRGWNRVPVSVPSGPAIMEHATVCMYSQRCTHLARLLTLTQYEPLVSWLRQLADADRDLRSAGNGEMGFRFYNLGGNPMLARLCDGGVDVVMDFVGSLPNDWVPGAYIAAKAGAFVGRVDGTPMTEEDLSLSLLDLGTSRVPYIAASSERLFRQAVALWQPIPTS